MPYTLTNVGFASTPAALDLDADGAADLLAGRSTGGVWVLRTSDGERVVSVARLVEDGEAGMDKPQDGQG